MGLFFLNKIWTVFFAVFIFAGIPTSQAASDSEQAFTKFDEAEALPVIDFDDLEKMSGKDIYSYYKELALLMAEMESFQGQFVGGPEAKAFLFKIIEESHAQGTETLPPYKMGNECLIGGYWGTIRSKSGSGTTDFTCDSSNRCKTSGGGSGHVCNPKFFTYADPSAAQPFCAPLTRDLTTSGCLPAFNGMYSKLCGGGTDYCPQFAEHFKASAAKAISQDPKYKGMSKSAALRKYTNEIFTEYKRIHNYCFEITKKANVAHTMGQDKSCFQIRAQYQKLLKVMNSVQPTNFACISSGLVKAGYSKPSQRQIAMFAVRSKQVQDNSILGPKLRGNNAIKSTILGISSVGVCSGQGLSAADQATVTGWLETDKLKTVDSAEYQRIFGVSPQIIPQEGWIHSTHAQRASRWYNGRNGGQYVRDSRVKSCPTKLTSAEQEALCVKLSKSCGLSTNSCAVKEPTGGSGNSTNNNGGSDSGGPTPEPSSPEVGNGQNAESDNSGSHGGDGPGQAQGNEREHGGGPGN